MNYEQSLNEIENIIQNGTDDQRQEVKENLNKMLIELDKHPKNKLAKKLYKSLSFLKSCID